jgi:biotin carboxyl carrier protein
MAEMTADGRLRAVVDGPEPLVTDVAPGATLGPRRGIVVTRLPSRAPRAGEPARFEVVVDGWRFEVALEPAARAELRERAARIGGGRATSVRQVIHAQIPGRVVSVSVVAGEAVERGQRLLSIEAMKMENAVLAPRAGTIERVGVAAGEDVELGDELVVVA